MEEVQKLTMTTTEIADLRLMLRVVAVQRYAEVVLAASNKAQTQMRCLGDLLRHADTYRVFDHHLAGYADTCSAQSQEEIEVLMNSASLKLYRDIVNVDFKTGVLATDTYATMVETCRTAQATTALRAKVTELADKVLGPLPKPEPKKEPEPVAINMAPAHGRN